MADSHNSNFSFANGLVNSVIRKYTHNWFQEEPFWDIESFYTPQMDAAVMAILDRRAVELFFLFSNEFVSKGISLDAFMDISEAMKLDFTTDAFNAEELIWFAIILAYYSAVAKNRGILTAPYCAISGILNYLDHYRGTGEFTNDSWHEVEQAAITLAQYL